MNMEHPDPDAEENQEWFQDKQNLSCSSPVEERAQWAAAQAGFASVGTRYTVGYPAGGHQVWIISSRNLLSYTVAEDGPCIQ